MQDRGQRDSSKREHGVTFYFEASPTVVQILLKFLLAILAFIGYLIRL